MSKEDNWYELYKSITNEKDMAEKEQELAEKDAELAEMKQKFWKLRMQGRWWHARVQDMRGHVQLDPYM